MAAFLQRAREQISYRFDQSVSRGTGALVAWLGVLSGALILLTGLVVYVFQLWPDDSPSFGQVLWRLLMRTLDAGTMGGDDGSWTYLLAMLFITACGIFVVSAFISIISAGLDDKIAELRRGRTLVVEDDYTLILGWSPLVPAIINELTIANESQRKATIVVLSNRDKVAMEEELRDAVSNWRTTRLVCRSGEPDDQVALSIVRPERARSVIVLSDGENDDADMTTVKTLLALSNLSTPLRKDCHLVAQVHNREYLRVARMASTHPVSCVDVNTTVARIVVQTSQQPGLSHALTELFDFDGDEIYFTPVTELAGRTVKDALNAYENASVLGIAREGKTQVLPPLDTVLTTSDELIVVAADDSAIGACKPHTVDLAGRIKQAEIGGPTIQHTVMFWWEPRATAVIRELDPYVAPGSRLMVIAPTLPAADLDAMKSELNNLSLEYQQSDPRERAVLKQALTEDVAHVIVLSESSAPNDDGADALTLITLLHLRELLADRSDKVAIVSEMRLLRNRELASRLRSDDFVVSDRLIGLMLAQISEEERLSAVFDDLLDSDGSEIYLRPVQSYLSGTEATMDEIVAAAAEHGQIAFGIAQGNSDGNVTVKVNPAKSTRVRLEDDVRVVVLAMS
jgi:voltage-gated potassium channel Kch